MAETRLKTYIYLIGEPEPQFSGRLLPTSLEVLGVYFFYHKKNNQSKKMLSKLWYSRCVISGPKPEFQQPLLRNNQSINHFHCQDKTRSTSKHKKNNCIRCYSFNPCICIGSYKCKRQKSNIYLNSRHPNLWRQWHIIVILLCWWAPKFVSKARSE